MRLTPTLDLRALIAKLHPPIATTPQQNKELLFLLSSSFRKRLDDAHPPILPTGPRVSGPAVGNASARATIEHLQSVLHHPLLTPSPFQPTEPQSAAVAAVVMMDRVLIDGKPNFNVVRQCLHMYSQTTKKGDADPKHEHRMSSKISTWYTTSSTDTKRRILSSPTILQHAVPILYTEGLEEVVWEWLKTLYSWTGKPLHWWVPVSSLTFLMIKEALRRSRLNAAVVQINQTCAYVQRTGRISSDARLVQTWKAAVKTVILAILRKGHHHGLSSHLFDEFLEHRQSWSDSDMLTLGLISLYHPTRPSAKALVIAVEQESDQVKAHLGEMNSMPELARKTMLNALLDGARLLLDQDTSSREQGLLILNLVQNQYPTMAGEKVRIVTERAIKPARDRIGPSVSMPFLAGIT